MTAETSVAAAPARPARSLAAVAAFPGQRRVRPPGSECRGLPEPSRGLGEAARKPIKLGRRVGRSDGTAAPAGRPCRDDCGGLWLFVSAMLDAVSGGMVIALFIVVPLIAVTAADERRTALVAGLTVVLTIAAGAWHGHRQDAGYRTGFTVACAVSVLAVMLIGMRRRRQARLAQTAVAQASQLAPLPPVINGISVAARYRSATPGACASGDLYDVIPTGHGIRVIIGDVRGRGVDAVLLARHVLSAFRRSAAAVPALNQVAGEISRAIKPHLGEEDFVTAVLVQISPGGELIVVNCGHHPPLLNHGGGLRPLAGQTAALPLGLDDDFTTFTASWRPGDRLLLYTDGLVESRNQHGDFLPEDQIAMALLAAGCDQALDALMTAVHRHTGGDSHDDMALLLLEHGTNPHSSANGQSRPGR
jgi:sigma-B regulation protein RsbU (phosphoserine phosphatase)